MASCDGYGQLVVAFEEGVGTDYVPEDFGLNLLNLRDAVFVKPLHSVPRPIALRHTHCVDAVVARLLDL